MNLPIFCRTKWKRQTTATMRAEQLRNHVCDEKDCPGAKRLSAEVSSAFCPRCHVVPAPGGHVVPAPGGAGCGGGVGAEAPGSAALLSRMYLRQLPVHIHTDCAPN